MKQPRRDLPPEIAVSDVRPVARRESSGTLEAIHASVRAALNLAMLEQAPVQIVLRGDLTAGRPARVIVGTPCRIAESADGRERVTLNVAEGTDQVVLIERVMRVLPAPPE